MAIASRSEENLRAAAAELAREGFDVLLKSMIARRAGSIVNIIGTGGKVASATQLPGGAANAALMLVRRAWPTHGAVKAFA